VRDNGILCVVDDFARECLALVGDASLSYASARPRLVIMRLLADLNRDGYAGGSNS